MVTLVISLNIQAGESRLPRINQNTLFSHYRLLHKIEVTHPVTGEKVEGYMPVGTAIGISDTVLLLAKHEVDAYPAEGFVIDICDEDTGWTLRRLDVEVYKKCEDQDLAIIKLKGKDKLPHHISLGKFNSKNIHLGDWVYAIGAKHGLSPYSITWGQIATKRHEMFEDYWQASASVSGGNSGGGMYSEDGQFLGVVLMRWGDNSCVLFLPTSVIKTWLLSENVKL